MDISNFLREQVEGVNSSKPFKTSIDILVTDKIKIDYAYTTLLRLQSHDVKTALNGTPLEQKSTFVVYVVIDKSKLQINGEDPRVFAQDQAEKVFKALHYQRNKTQGNTKIILTICEGLNFNFVDDNGYLVNNFILKVTSED
jgi:hypothetical protein